MTTTEGGNILCPLGERAGVPTADRFGVKRRMDGGQADVIRRGTEQSNVSSDSTLESPHIAMSDDRYLSTGDESGTAPGDRRFRPDVEGLRAIAIALVVLFHAGVKWISGGFVGVDVFFVISGFVITGLLLREHEKDGKNALSGFYARRARKIFLPQHW